MPPETANSEQTRAQRWHRGMGRDAFTTSRSLTVLVVLWVIGTTGCVTGRPNLAHPGNLQTQRFNAIAHDPYADPDLGPEVVGGRPRDFQKNLAEPVRNRWLMDSWWARTATGR